MSGASFNKLQGSPEHAAGIAALTKRHDGISASVAIIKQQINQLEAGVGLLKRDAEARAAWAQYRSEGRVQ